jgi:hypothetical protein
MFDLKERREEESTAAGRNWESPREIVLTWSDSRCFCNSTVDTADFDFWRARFGNTAAGAAATVPEPTVWLLITLGISGSLLRVCR